MIHDPQGNHWQVAIELTATVCLKRPGAIRWTSRNELAAWQEGRVVVDFDAPPIRPGLDGLRRVGNAWVRA